MAAIRSKILEHEFGIFPNKTPTAIKLTILKLSASFSRTTCLFLKYELHIGIFRPNRMLEEANNINFGHLS